LQFQHNHSIHRVKCGIDLIAEWQAMDAAISNGGGKSYSGRLAESAPDCSLLLQHAAQALLSSPTGAALTASVCGPRVPLQKPFLSSSSAMRAKTTICQGLNSRAWALIIAGAGLFPPGDHEEFFEKNPSCATCWSIIHRPSSPEARMNDSRNCAKGLRDPRWFRVAAACSASIRAVVEATSANTRWNQFHPAVLRSIFNWLRDARLEERGDCFTHASADSTESNDPQECWIWASNGSLPGAGWVVAGSTGTLLCLPGHSREIRVGINSYGRTGHAGKG